MTNQIKIGVAVDSLTLENWKLNFIEKIRSSDEYSVNIIHIAKQKEIGPFYFFIFIYKLIDRLIFRQRCILLKKNKLKSNLILDSIVEKEPSQNLKIIFNLSLTKLKTTDFPNSKIWEIEHEDHWFLGYMSFALNKLTISSKLVQRNDNSIILTSTSAVHKNSVNKTLTNHLIKVQSFGLRSLKRISIQGDRINKDTELPNRISQKNSYLNQTKLGIYLFIRINKSFFESIKNRINSINVGEKWYILLKVKEFNYKLEGFSKLESPADCFWADPFIVKRAGKTFVFCEEKKLNSRFGNIAVFEIYQDGTYSKSTTVINEDYHLSYPFIFEYENNLYMIPESSGNNTIQLYKCIEFPYTWKFEKVLFENICAVDTTLFEYNSKWWLFTNISEDNSSLQDELHLFYTKNPIEDNWIPHQLNPIVSDVRKARSAGNIFFDNGKIIRPSQNAIPHYGYSFFFNQIHELSESNYSESAVNEFKPWGKGIRGTHTYNHLHPYSIIDARIQYRK